jgi:hypothetical protein
MGPLGPPDIEGSRRRPYNSFLSLVNPREIAAWNRTSGARFPHAGAIAVGDQRLSSAAGLARGIAQEKAQTPLLAGVGRSGFTNCLLVGGTGSRESPR